MKPDRTPNGARRRAGKLAGIALGAALLAMLVAEFAFRAFESHLDVRPAALVDYRQYLLSGVMEYEPRAHTVFQRPIGRGGNRDGFSDVDHAFAKTPGVPRIVCLGGSTTESGNTRGRLGSYPYYLEQSLERRTGRDFEVMNAGMSGWTTAEMLVAWFLTLQHYAPDVLVLHEAVNDVAPRLCAGFRSDYETWRRPLQVRPSNAFERTLARCSDLYVYLHLRFDEAHTITDVTTFPDLAEVPGFETDTLPHVTSLPFRSNVLSIARAARAIGCQVVLMTMPSHPPSYEAIWEYGIDEHNQHLRELCAENGYLLADVARDFETRPGMPAQFTDIVHLLPDGNRAKAEILADCLAGWVAALPTDGARAPIDPFAAPVDVVRERRRRPEANLSPR